MSALYSVGLLRLASEDLRTGRLHAPDATVERRSTTCGSRIVADVVVDPDGRIRDYAHEVRACALGQAAATLLGRHVIGRDASELASACANLAQFLSGTRDDPGDWPGIDALAVARDYPARHPSIRLAFEAAREAAASAVAGRAAA